MAAFSSLTRSLSRSSLGLRAAGLAILAIAGVGLPVGMLVQRAISPPPSRMVDAVIATLGDLVETQLLSAGTLPGDPNVAAWRDALLHDDARVMLVGILVPGEEMVVLHRRGALATDGLASAIPTLSDSGVIPLPDANGVEHLLAYRRLASGALLAAVIDPGESVAVDRPTTVDLLLAGCGLIGLILTATWFRVTIAQPLEALGSRLSLARNRMREILGATDAPRELEAIVGKLGELTVELDRWRTEAAYLRYTAENTIDARTREAKLAVRKAEQEALTDPLTALGNRRALDRDLPELFDAQRLESAELSLLAIDINRFKDLNDTCGHNAGDDLLRVLGQLIRSTIRRPADRGYRLGGDEFIITLPDTTAANATVLAQRLAALFSQSARLAGKLDPPPSLAIGVASRRQHGAATWKALVAQADEAMYAAKRRGRKAPGRR